MQRTPEGPDHPRPGESSSAAGRTRRSAAALAAMAVLGIPGHSAAQSAEPVDPGAHSQRPDGVEGPSRTVQATDSLWSIAVANGLSVEELMEWNGLSGDALLVPGQQLRLRAPDQPLDDGGDEAALIDAPSLGLVDDPETTPARHVEHRVRRGETLWDLGRLHGVGVAELVQANDLDVAAPLGDGALLQVPVRSAGTAPVESAPPVPAGDPRRPAAEAALRLTGGLSPDGVPPQEETLASAHHHLEQISRRPAPPAEELQDMVRQAAEQLGVDPVLALAHAEHESGFAHHRVSSADAVGVMQVVPAAGAWASAVEGRDLDLLDPLDNVTAGVTVIRENLRITPTLDQAIGAYHQGAFGIEEYGMFSDTKEYVHGVRSAAAVWDPAG